MKVWCTASIDFFLSLAQVASGPAAATKAAGMPQAAATLLVGLLLLLAGGCAGAARPQTIGHPAAPGLRAAAAARGSGASAPAQGARKSPETAVRPAPRAVRAPRAPPAVHAVRSADSAVQPRAEQPAAAPTLRRRGWGVSAALALARRARAAAAPARRAGPARVEPPRLLERVAERKRDAGAAYPTLTHPAARGRRLAEYTELTNTTELPVLRAMDRGCRRLVVVWCAVKTPGEGANVYDSYLKVSMLSVLEKAPSLVPVLLFDGAPDHPLAAWMRGMGGIVIVHTLSFKQAMVDAVTDDLYRWQTTTWLASFSYFDIGLIADELRNRTQARASAPWRRVPGVQRGAAAGHPRSSLGRRPHACTA